MASFDVHADTPATSLAAGDLFPFDDISANAGAGGWDTITAAKLLAALAAVVDSVVAIQNGLTVRQAAGVAGTDEVQITHTGANVLIENMDTGGDIRLKVGAVTLIYSNAGQLTIGSALVGGGSGNVLGNPGLISTGTIRWTSGGTPAVSFDTGFKRAAAAVVGVTNASTGSGTLSSIPITPSQITADQNNYAPTAGAMFYRLSSDASRTITGLVAGVDGQVCHLLNVGSQNIVVANESGSSTAANRFTSETGADITVPAKARVSLVYDGTASRWLAYPSKNCT